MWLVAGPLEEVDAWGGLLIFIKLAVINNTASHLADRWFICMYMMYMCHA